MDHPVLRKSFHETAGSRRLWLLAAAAGLLGVAGPYRPDDVAAALTVTAAAGAAYQSMQFTNREEASGTLELLGTAPIGFYGLVFQVSAGAALGWLAITVPPMAFVWAVHGGEGLSTWLRGAAITGLLSWRLALGMYHSEVSYLRQAIGLVVYLGVMYADIRCIDFVIHSSFPAPLAVLGFAGMAGATTIVENLVLRLADIRWPGSFQRKAPPRQAKVGDAALVRRPRWSRWSRCWAAPVPDITTPFVWRDLQAGLGLALKLCLALGLASLLSVARYGPLASREAGVALVTLGYAGALFLAVTAASRTEADRRGGAWRDLALVPLSPRALVTGRLLGMLATSTLVLGTAILALLTVARPITSGLACEAAIIVGSILVVWTGAILAGQVAGSLGEGWVGGAIALGLLYVACIGVIALESVMQRAAARETGCGLVVVGLWFISVRQVTRGLQRAHASGE